MTEEIKLTAEEISEITAYLDATTPLPAHADIIFVFGTRHLTPARIAAELYLRDIAPLVVLTGGENRSADVNEAEAHYNVLIQAGIPAEKVIIENRSTNTLENVTFALPLIETRQNLASIRTVLAVCKWMHSRRALMTLKRQLPHSIRYYAHTYEPRNITRENWHLNPRGEAANVLKEWENIPRYLQQGYLEELLRDGDSYV